MKNSIVLFSVMGLLCAGCEMEGQKAPHQGEKQGEMKKEMPAKPMNGQDKMMQDKMQNSKMEK